MQRLAGTLAYVKFVTVTNATTTTGSIRDRLRTLLGPGQMPPGSRVPSLRELAKRLEVSHVLVARHMRELEAEGVVVQGSERIRFTARSGAQSVDQGRMPSGTVVVLSDLPQADPSSPFQYHTGQMTAATDGVHAAGGMTCVIRPPRTAEALARLAGLKPDGWIAFEHGLGGNPGLVAFLGGVAAGGVPVAIAGDPLPEDAMDAFPGSIITTDHRGGAADLVRTLHRRGRRRLAVGWVDVAHPGLGLHWLRQRARGIADAVAELGLAPPRELLLPTLPPPEDPRHGFERQTEAWAGSLISSVLRCADPIDGLLAISDGAAYPLLAAARLVGRDPGVDLDVTGYDNYWAGVLERSWAGALPCATVDKDGGAVGRALAAAVGSAAPRRQRLVVPSRLVLTG